MRAAGVLVIVHAGEAGEPSRCGFHDDVLRRDEAFPSSSQPFRCHPSYVQWLALAVLSSDGRRLKSKSHDYAIRSPKLSKTELT